MLVDAWPINESIAVAGVHELKPIYRAALRHTSTLTYGVRRKSIENCLKEEEDEEK